MAGWRMYGGGVIGRTGGRGRAAQRCGQANSKAEQAGSVAQALATMLGAAPISSLLCGSCKLVSKCTPAQCYSCAMPWQRSLATPSTAHQSWPQTMPVQAPTHQRCTRRLASAWRA